MKTRATTEIQFFVIISSRFKITLATVVQAASSLWSSFSLRGDSPTLKSFSAAPLALQMKLPLIPLRKPGKLPYRTYSLKYELEYGSAELHVHSDGVAEGARVLLVDDLLATGGTMRAGCQLIEQAGGKIAGCAFLVELTFLKGREQLRPHEVFSLIQY